MDRLRLDWRESLDGLGWERIDVFDGRNSLDRLDGLDGRRGRAGSFSAQVGARLAYPGMLLAEHGGSGSGHPAQAAARLMPVAQLVGNDPKRVRQGEHHRFAVAKAQLPGRDGLLQNPARGRRLARLTMHAGEHVRGAEHVGMIFSEAGLGDLKRLLQHQARASKVTVGSQSQSILLDGGQVHGLRHADMLPGQRGIRQPRVPARLCGSACPGVE